MQTAAAAAAAADATQLNTPFSRIPGPVTALASAKSLQSSTGKRQTLFIIMYTRRPRYEYLLLRHTAAHTTVQIAHIIMHRTRPAL